MPGRDFVLSSCSSSGKPPCKASEGYVGSTYRLFFVFFMLMMMMKEREGEGERGSSLPQVTWESLYTQPCIPSPATHSTPFSSPPPAPPSTWSRPVPLHPALCPPLPTPPMHAPPCSLVAPSRPPDQGSRSRAVRMEEGRNGGKEGGIGRQAFTLHRQKY